MYTFLIHASGIYKANGYGTGNPCRQCMLNCRYYQSYGLYCFQHELKTKNPASGGAFVVSGFRNALQITRQHDTPRTHDIILTGIKPFRCFDMYLYA